MFSLYDISARPASKIIKNYSKFRNPKELYMPNNAISTI
jgi:hypothetical protein